MNEAEAERQIAEVIEMVADRIAETWGKAYPEDQFPELPRGEGGVSDEARTRISASMGRHMAAAIERQLREWAQSVRE